MANYTKRLFKGTVIVFLASIFAGLIAYLTRIVLARSLTPAEYGLLFAVMNFILLFDLFKDLGLGNALVKYIPDFLYKKRPDKIKASIISVFLIQLFSALIFVIVVFFLSNWLAENFFKSPDSLLILRMFLLMFLLSVLTYNLKSIFQGFQFMKSYSLLEFFRKFFAFIFILIFFKLGFGLMGVVYSYILVYVVVPIIMFPILLKRFNLFKYKASFSKPLVRKLVFFGIPTALAYIGASFIGYMDTLFITYFRTMSEVGLYNVALPTSMFLYYLSSSLLVVIFPLVSELWAKRQKDKVAKGLALLQKYVFMITLPIVLVIVPFSQLLINVFFGAEYEPASIALQILVVGILFYIIADLNLIVLSGIGQPKIFAKVILFTALINLIANFLLVPPYGYVGAAIATAISYLSALALSLGNIRKHIPINIPWMNLVKILLSGIIVVGIVNSLKNILFLNAFLEMAICIAVAGAVYISLLFLLKIITLKEIKDLTKSIKR